MLTMAYLLKFLVNVKTKNRNKYIFMFDMYVLNADLSEDNSFVVYVPRITSAVRKC